MNGFRSLIFSAVAIGAVVLLIVARDPYDPRPHVGPEELTLAEPPPPPPPPEEALPPAPAEVDSWFAMAWRKDLSLVFEGVVPSEAARGRLLAAARQNAPELVSVADRIEVVPLAKDAPWLDRAPELIETLVAGVREPSLHVEKRLARIGGASDDEPLLAGIRGSFASLFSEIPERDDQLRLDPMSPAPETRLPLVLYLGTIEGEYVLEGSLPSAEHRAAVVAAARASADPDRFADHTRVSPNTVEEAWLETLPNLVGAMLAKGSNTMELIVVDRILTLRGEVPDEAAKAGLLELAKPAREAGYEVRDELTAKR